jgi:DMSO/TMAO reductase YedYZ molybdopterin-dependent catalytic subunit
MKSRIYILVGLVIVSVTLIALGFLSARTLDSVEVREYQGQRLSSVNDFRENSIKGPQNIDISNYSLTVTGLVNQSKSYSYGEVIGHTNYEKVVTLYCVEGWNVKILWKGVLVSDLLKETGVYPNANTVIFYAYDGYSTSLPLDFIEKNNIMLAYGANGEPLSPSRGFPFQLVAESKYGYKWIKWVTKIELSDNKSYSGYWESRGYSNEADVQ